MAAFARVFRRFGSACRLGEVLRECDQLADEEVFSLTILSPILCLFFSSSRSIKLSLLVFLKPARKLPERNHLRPFKYRYLPQLMPLRILPMVVSIHSIARSTSVFIRLPLSQ